MLQAQEVRKLYSLYAIWTERFIAEYTLAYIKMWNNRSKLFPIWKQIPVRTFALNRARVGKNDPLS